MDWLNQLKQAIARGRSAIMCTGAVTDGFPGTMISETYHADQLLSWQQFVEEGVPHLRGWTFDPAFGFRFHSPESDAMFNALLQDEDEAKTKDPIALARQTVRANTLPTDPDAALRMMRYVCDRMPLQSSRTHLDSVRCLILLPNMDGWLGRIQTGVGNNNTTAMMVEHLFTSETYRAKGIVFIASTMVMEALHERLRHKHLPLARVHIAIPNEAMRRAFIVRLCNHEQRVLRDRLAALEIEHTGVVARVERDSTSQHKRFKDALIALQHDIQMKRQGVRAIRRAEEDYEAYMRSERELVEAWDRDKRLAEIRLEMRSLNSRISSHMLQVTPKNVRVITQTMKMGDGFYLSPGVEGLHIIHEIGKGKEFTLKMGASGSPKVGSDFKPISYRFTILGHGTQEQVAFEVGTRTGQWSNFHQFNEMDTTRFPIYVPRENILHALRLDELARELEHVDQIHAARVEEARRKVQTAERVRLEVLRKNLPTEHELMTSYRRELDQYAQFARDPESHLDVKVVVRKIQETQEQLRELLDRGFCPIPEQGIIEAAYDLHGLGFRQIATLLLDTRSDNVPLTRKEILATRIDLLRQAYGHLFEVVEPMYGFEGIGGLDDIKTYFTEVRDAILRKEYRAVPMGTLLMGPPGTGKTAVAEALARECGFLYVKVKSTKSMWVGESERIIAEMFLALRELAPVIVLRDEVDRTDVGRDQVQGDSGVSAHQQGAWMQFLSDPAIRGQIFVVSCTNRPDLLDAALKRAGRTDERIPVLMPDEATRASVFAVMTKRYDFPHEIESFDPYAKLTANRSGADIEVIVRRAYQYAVSHGGDKITNESLTWAIDDYIDNASKLDAARMTMIAIRSASSKRFLPKNMEEVIAQCMQTLATELGGVLVTEEPVATPEPTKEDAN